MEPKIPKIVIGGSASAKNVPVTGRYIQLLGLGTVVTTKDERGFFQLLRSHEGLDTDLVSVVKYLSFSKYLLLSDLLYVTCGGVKGVL